MNETELIITAGMIGMAIPITLYGVYWLALDQAKRYVDSEIREAKQDVREYARNQNE